MACHLQNKWSPAKVLGRSKSWRVFATGLSFAVFGIGGAFIALTWFNLLNLCIRDKTRRKSLSRRAIARAFWIYIRFMYWLGLLTYEFKGLEKLRSGQLIISNHPSLLDVVFLVSVIRECNCVVKAALLKNPFTYGPVSGSNYITSDEEEILESCVNTLTSGDSLVIFPEGTRSTPGEKPKFKRGATNIALYAGVDITPIRIKCDPPTLLKGQKWYDVPDTPPHFSFEVLDDVCVQHYLDCDLPRSIINRRLTRELEDLLCQPSEIEAVVDSTATQTANS